MPLGISELVAKIGDADIELQNLDTCGISLDYHHKKGTTITFGTSMNISAPEGTEKLGLVIWLDRKRVAEILASSKAGG